MELQDILNRPIHGKHVNVQLLKQLEESNDLTIHFTKKSTQETFNTAGKLLKIGIQKDIPFLVMTIEGNLHLIDCPHYMHLKAISIDKNLPLREQRLASMFNIQINELQTKDGITIEETIKVLENL